MEAFHNLKVKCPYEILEIEYIKIKNKPNEHGFLYFKGIVDDSINFKYSIEASTDDKICIYEDNEDEEESIIFYGTIQNIRTNNVDGIYYIELEAYTSSFDLDIEEKSRSFQDADMSYDDLIETILLDYKIYSYNQCMKRPMSIGRPFFQYKETDFKFLIRTASYLGLEVYCDIIDPDNVFYFGRPSGIEYEIEDDIDYSATLDIQRYRQALVENSDLHHTDFFFYEFKTSKVMEAGSQVIFKQKKFYVYSYEAEYVRGELIYTYKLCRENGIWQEKLYNDKLIGISLEGEVLEVSGEKVKLHLDIDESQNQAKAAWFRYAPPTGNIMYSMPIVGTNANLYFPNERNEDPIVIGCVRKNGSSCEKFSHVNNRYFSTESGNNLDLLPDAVNFSRPGLSANFNDGSGITLSSSSSLSINAGYVGLFAGNVSIEGKTKLVAEKGESSSISLENDFYNSAAIIMENGSDRSSNEPFDDDPQNGAKAVKAAIEAAVQFAVGAIAAASEGAIASIGDFSSLANSSETQSNCSESSEKSPLESALDFIFPATPCYAAEKEGSTNSSKKEETYITKASENVIPVDTDPYRVNKGESGDGFWGKVADWWVSTPVYDELASMAEWQDDHPQDMELLNIGMIFAGMTAAVASSPIAEEECEVLEKSAKKVTNKSSSISDEEIEKFLNSTKELSEVPELKSLYRAVGPDEFYQIMETGTFEVTPKGLQAKQFGLNLQQTINFAERYPDLAAVVEVKIPQEVLDKVGDFQSVDRFIFKDGTVTIHADKLDEFNKAIEEILHVY